MAWNLPAAIGAGQLPKQWLNDVRDSVDALRDAKIDTWWPGGNGYDHVIGQTGWHTPSLPAGSTLSITLDDSTSWAIVFASCEFRVGATVLNQIGLRIDAGNREPLMTVVNSATISRSNASFTHIIEGLASGTHTFQLRVNTANTATTLTTTQFFVMAQV